MASSSKRQMTMAKRDREQAVREKRARKQQKKEERKQAAAAGTASVAEHEPGPDAGVEDSSSPGSPGVVPPG